MLPCRHPSQGGSPWRDSSLSASSSPQAIVRKTSGPSTTTTSGSTSTTPALCPNFLSGTVYKLRGGHVGIDIPSEYVAIYEVDAESYEEAERVLNEWQRDPNAWEGRAEHNRAMAETEGTPLKVKGSGWYEFECAYHTRG